MAGCGLSREEALKLLEQNVSQINLRRHCLATAAIMKALALQRGEDADLWEITGLLHDLDFERTESDPARHGLDTIEKLRGLLPEEALHAIASHNSENNGVARETTFDQLLTAAECVTGLIAATALVYPDRKIAQVEPSSVMKRMGKSGFARAVSRDGIRMCEPAGLALEPFVSSALEAMKSISDDLGL
jgi:putative nucleotidyltransferase with HDIG domain